MCQALPPHLSLCSVWLCLGFFHIFFPLNFFEVELMVHLLVTRRCRVRADSQGPKANTSRVCRVVLPLARVAMIPLQGRTPPWELQGRSRQESLPARKEQLFRGQKLPHVVL